VSTSRRVFIAIGCIFGLVVAYVSAALLIMYLEDRRFAAITPGVSQQVVIARFGRPTYVETREALRAGSMLGSGCNERDRECWTYLSRVRGDHRVCFDERRRVTCSAQALVWR
jgi:hypothetical protein